MFYIILYPQSTHMNPILIILVLIIIIDLITIWCGFDDKTHINDNTITRTWLIIQNIIWDNVSSHIVSIIHTYESNFDHNYNLLVLNVIIDLVTIWYGFDDKTQINDRTIMKTSLFIINIIWDHISSHIVSIIHTYESHFEISCPMNIFPYS